MRPGEDDGSDSFTLNVTCLCLRECCGLTLIAANAHAIVEEKVHVGELAHHTGCFVEGL